MSEIDINDINSTVWIRTPSNKMEGVFVLYQTDESEISASAIIAKLERDYLTASISVRVQRDNDKSATLNVMYRGNDYLVGHLLVGASSNIDSHITVRPNNRMFGMFEVLPPPRVEKLIPSTEDSTTRSRIDVMTINYGDSQKMMVGRTVDDSFESFVRFGNLNEQMKKLSVLERANVRLYYVGDIVDGTDLELHLPNTKWSEYGVTYANRPSSTSRIANTYTINKDEKYVEFDIKLTVTEWLKSPSYNFGLIVRSSSNYTTSFYTREGRFKPSLNIKYITDEVVSLGKAELESTMFVWGVGYPEINATLEVHSDWASASMDSTLYVHRYEAPVYQEVKSYLATTKPDQHAKMIISKRDKHEITAYLSVQVKAEESLLSLYTVSKPDVHAWLTVDPNMTLESTLVVAKRVKEGIDAFLIVSQPDLIATLSTKKSETLDATMIIGVNTNAELPSFLHVSREKIDSYLIVRALGNRYLDSRLAVKVTESEDNDSYLSVSRPDMDSKLIARAIDKSEISATLTIERIEESSMNSFLSVTREEVFGHLKVVLYDESNIDGSIEVPNYDWVDSTMMVHEISELVGTMMVTKYSEIDGVLIATKPDLAGYLYPRVYGEDNLNVTLHVRQRDVSDLNSRLMVKGKGNFGAYYFII